MVLAKLTGYLITGPLLGSEAMGVMDTTTGWLGWADCDGNVYSDSAASRRWPEHAKRIGTLANDAADFQMARR